MVLSAFVHTCLFHVTEAKHMQCTGVCIPVYSSTQKIDSMYTALTEVYCMLYNYSVYLVVSAYVHGTPNVHLLGQHKPL